MYIEQLQHQHTKFQLSSKIKWKDIRGTVTGKIRKTNQKTTFLALKGCNEAEKSNLPKSTSMSVTKFTYQISTS